MPAAAKTTPPAEKKGEKKIVKLVGVVESDKRSKTRRVAISYQLPHSKYGKYVSRQSIIQIHDEHNTSKLGDTVEIIPCRPVSSTKRWTLSRVVEKAKG
jgi:small subunit ribosomal protein S17